MKLIDRSRIATGNPVAVADLADHLRVEATETASAMRFARAAADEIEQHAALALLTQEIVAETTDTPGAVVHLPIGPVQAGAAVTVEQLAEDRTATPIATGWQLVHGRYPSLLFTTIPEGLVRVTYEAGFGANDTDLPRDLSMAILDQAIRLYDKRGDMDTSPDWPRQRPAYARATGA